MAEKLQVVISGGTPTDERPEGWADPIAEFICDLFGVEDHRNDQITK